MRKMFKAIFSYFGTQWYERLVSLFIACIIASTLSIFENYWWQETYTIAYYTLFAAVIVDWLLPIKQRVIRGLLQTIAAIVITFRYAMIDWNIAAPADRSEWLWWLEQHVVQLHPFIWISLALLFIHLIFNYWTTTRPRVFGIIGAGILMLTIADSFTPIWLWDNVAIVVLVGLIWLVASHLHKLQRTHPDSTNELFEYPIQLILPTVIVLSVLMLIGINMPSVSPLLQDPYTLWKQARGEQVQVYLGDKAHPSVRTPTATGNASSGYSRVDSVLGGGFDYDYSPMMTVSTNQRSYWRGESKAIYTGTGWETGLSSSSQRVNKDAELFEGEGRELAETIEVNQIVLMLRDDIYPVLFGAAPITQVRWIESEEAELDPSLRWMPDMWELRWNEDNAYPGAYALTSNITVLDEEGLRSAQAVHHDSALHAQYTLLPDTVTDRVRQLAAEITAEGATDYDKARLLENYLRLNYAYNNRPDLTKLTGESTDFVDGFLFELLEGYCDYFSTAMAVMGRSLDLPTRWVKGFAPGVLPMNQYGPPGDGIMDGEDYNPSGAGTYTVRNSDAHSWVEIYFAGYGWIPFEPTAGFSFPYSTPAGEAIDLPELDLGEVGAAPEAAQEKTSASGAWGWIGAIALIVAAGAILIVRRRSIATLWYKLRTGHYNANELMVIEMYRLMRFCKKRGLQREEHETVREAVIRWSQSQRRLKDEFRFVLDRFEQAKYGSEAATKEEAERFVNKVRYLIGELK